MLPILENGRKTIKRKCMANTNLNRQVIDIRTSSGVGDISNEVLRRWTDKGYDMAVKEGNYDRSREHLNFEIVNGGKLVPVDKSRPLDQRMAEMLASRGLEQTFRGLNRPPLYPVVMPFSTAQMTGL